MLNEFQQAYEYMYDQKNMTEKPLRMKEGIFLHNDDFNGLEGIMTSIARFFVFEDGAPNIDIGVRRAEAALRMWLGLTDSLSEGDKLFPEYNYLKDNYPWLEGWMMINLEEQVRDGTEVAKERVRSAGERRKLKASQFATRSLNKNKKVSDYKKVRYDKVIANALVARGPLKRYYLVCMVPVWKTGLNKIRGTNPNGALKENDEDKVLKLLAAYLLERERKLKSNDDHVYEQVNFSDIGFWQYAQGKLDSSKYKVYTYQSYEGQEKRPLFSFYSAKSHNVCKAKPDEEWFEICGWELIEATENDDKLDEYLDEHPNAIFFSDPGASQYLRKNERYQRL